MSEQPRPQINLDDFGDLLGVEDVADILGVHLDTARRYVREGAIPASRMPGGRRYYILKQDVVEALRNHRVDPEREDEYENHST